ncbi:MAG: ABC transporter permease [Promethearchaeia archaeon]
MLSKIFLREALKQLKYRKFKSIVIIISITIGISFFIGITSIGEGIRVKIISEIKESEDLTLIKVSPGYSDGTVTYINDYSVSYIENIDNVKMVLPFVLDSYVFSTLDLYFDVTGVDANRISDIFNLDLKEGSWFEKNTNETVLGYELAKRFETQKGIRLNDNFTAKIRIYDGKGGYYDKSVNFIIKGILNSADYELNGKDINNLLLFDISMAKELDEKSTYDGLIVKAEDSSYSIEITEIIEDELGLNATCAQEKIDTANNFATLITISLGFFSGLTLILGSVLIISITTISVLQRTTEIGVMKALGASETDILKMIIYECLILGLISGILGIIGGIFFALLIDTISKPIIENYLGTQFTQNFQLTIITPQLLLIGFSIALLTCILSGIPPAIKASKLNPVDALRRI